jgi:hypothetical protein
MADDPVTIGAGLELIGFGTDAHRLNIFDVS